MQREFYLQRGLRAWSHDLVPNFVTNNPFIAETYASIVLGFITDCIQQGLPPKTPIRILELGAGPGKFSCLFLRQLGPLLRDKGLSLSLVRYCMTDCSEALIESWSANSWLAEFVQDGILQFELLEAGENITSGFLPSGPAGRGPLVVIANYVFDSLPQDAFVIQDGRISQVLVTTQSPAEATGNKPELSRLQLSYKNVPLAAGHYADQTWNEILDLYKARLTSATVLFPAHALKALNTLGQLSDGRMLVLAADKGFAHEDALQLSQGPPALEFHTPNCFSLMVNFDAMAKFFCAEGGQALLPDKHFSNLNLCGFLHGRAGYNFFQTKAAYDREQSGFGVDDLFTLLAWLNAHMEEMSVPQILAALRLTRWDTVAFMRFFPILARQLRNVVAERNDLRTAVMRTWANHYPIASGENEIAFQCGVVLLELRFFEDAIAMFQTSQRIFAPSAATSYNLGLCYQGLGRRMEALQSIKEACNLDPTFQPARLTLEKLEREA